MEVCFSLLPPIVPFQHSPSIQASLVKVIRQPSIASLLKVQRQFPLRQVGRIKIRHSFCFLCAAQPIPEKVQLVTRVLNQWREKDRRRTSPFMLCSLLLHQGEEFGKGLMKTVSQECSTRVVKYTVSVAEWRKGFVVAWYMNNNFTGTKGFSKDQQETTFIDVSTRCSSRL